MNLQEKEHLAHFLLDESRMITYRNQQEENFMAFAVLLMTPIATVELSTNYIRRAS